MPKPKTSYGKTIAPLRQKLGLPAKGRLPKASTIYKNASSQDVQKVLKDSKASGVSKTFGMHSFPGKMSGSTTGIKSGTPGLFTQSVKGMKGKKFIEKALDRTLQMYLSGMEE